MKRVVITGVTGAIGRALVRRCIENGYEVLCVVHRASKRAAELQNQQHCKVLFLDLAEYATALPEMERQGIPLEKYDAFFHLAWMAPFGEQRNNLSLQLENVAASLAAVQLAKDFGCTTFVGTGSQAEYGRTNVPLSPETPTFPETGYGIAKLCAGQMTRLACEQLGIKHIWMRVLSVYGPHDREQTLISTAITKMLQSEDTTFSPCDQLWDYIYADDAAELIMRAAEKGKHGKVYMVGSGEAQPLKDFLFTIALETGYEKQLGFGKLDYNDKQVMYLKADMESTQKDLKWFPKTSFQEGIRRTILWKQS